MYAMLYTKLDVAYTSGIVSRFQANLGEDHQNAVKNILKYLRRTKDIFLVYRGSDLKLKGYSDSSSQSDFDDSKSTLGYVFTLNSGAVSQKSSKQQTVTDSTIEAKYIAASEDAKKAVWMKKFITELDVVLEIENSVPLYYNNTGAVAQVKKLRSHQKSTHILRCFHLVRELIERQDIVIERVETKNNIADPFTKALPQQQFDHHLDYMVIKYKGDWLQCK